MEILEAVSSLSLKNVLLATDLTPSSDKALLYARALAREHGSHVYTLHVSGPDDYQLLCPEAFAETFNQLGDDGIAGAGILRGLLRGLPREVPVHGRQVWEIIEDVAARNQIDLLILGTHGRTGMQKMMFGSIAEAVFREVSCPVLTVGARAREPQDGLKINRVLLATDCCATSLVAAHAASICERFGSELTILAVAPEHAENQSLARHKVKEHLYATAPQLQALYPPPIFALEVGEPAEMILQTAAAIDADLIVLGTHQPADVRTASHFLWATASQVIAGSFCPVLTVRGAGTGGAKRPFDFINSIGR